MARRIAYTGEPVLTLDEVARQCRLDPEDMQAELIERVIIPGVTQQAEAISGAAIRTAEYEEIWPCRFTSGHVLDVGQASEITEVACLDNAGAWQPTEMLAQLDVGGRESRLRDGTRAPCRQLVGLSPAVTGPAGRSPPESRP